MKTKKSVHLTHRAGSKSGRGASAQAGPGEAPQANGSVRSTLTRPADTLSRSHGRGELRGGEGLIPAGEQLLDPKEVGKRLKLSPRTVSEMANEGRLPAYRVGIYLRFKWAEVEHSLRRATEVKAESAGRTGQ